MDLSPTLYFIMANTYKVDMVTEAEKDRQIHITVKWGLEQEKTDIYICTYVQLISYKRYLESRYVVSIE